MLNSDLISELKNIVLEVYGIEMEADDVIEFGETLLNYYELLLKINKGLAKS